MSNLPIFAGNNNVVTGIDGCKYTAENGLICYTELNGNYGSISVRDAEARVRGISELYGDRRFDRGFHTRDEVAAAQKFISGMTELCRIAKIQGTPDDPSAVRDLVRRRKKTVRIATPLTSMD